MSTDNKQNGLEGLNNTNRDKAIAAWHESHSEENAPMSERVISRRLSSTTNGTNYDLFSRSKSKPITEKIKTCRSAYFNIGLIGNVVDIMTDFALEGLTIVHESLAAERFFNKWAKKVQVHRVAEEILKDIYRDGNVPIVHYDAKISEDSVRRMKRAVAAVGGSDLFCKDDVEPMVIPYKFRVLDVLHVKSRGKDLFGRPSYYYEFNLDEVKATLRRTDQETKELVAQMKKGMTPKQWERFITTGEFPLTDLYMIYYKKDSYTDWAIPMLWRVVDDLKFKHTLRSMDISIAESIQNAVQIFKLGDIKSGYPPSPAMFQKFADMLRNPSKSKQIVWDDLVSIESDYPDTGKILGADKYTQVNADILAGLGISEVLIGGPGGKYSNSFLSCRTLLERLETGRYQVLEWLSCHLMNISKALGLRKPPVVKFAHMSLRDENAEKKMLLELVDRNIISYKTLLERFGEDLDIEVNRMRREDKLRKSLEEKSPNTLKKLGKFGPHDQGQQDNDNEASSAPSAQGPAGEAGGRPEKGENPAPEQKQEVQRDTKPKGMAVDKKYKVAAYQAFKNIKQVVAEQVAESRNVKASALNAADLAEIGEIAMDVMSRFSNIESINSENIINAVFYKVEAPAKLDRCVKQVYKKLVKKYKEKNGKAPSEKAKDKLRSSAWAICRKQLGE